MTQPYKKTMLVLSVEDNAADAFMIEELFKAGSKPSEVINVRDGIDAIKFLRREGIYAGAKRPDLVILDLNLPGKDGREVLREIRSDPELTMLPVLVLSTSSSPADVRICYELHVNCYFTKPSDLVQFNDTMRAIEDCWLRLAVLPPAPEYKNSMVPQETD